MFYSKKVISAAVLSGLLISTAAFAAGEQSKHGATVTFKAQLRDAACDVTSTTEGDTVDFGTFTIDKLGAAAANTQIGATKDFSLVLTNCSKASDPAKVFIYADGQASNYSQNYFANRAAQSLAVQIFHGTDAATGTTLVPNKATELTSITKMTEGTNASIPLKANLMLTQAASAAQPEALSVPVTFSVAYN